MCHKYDILIGALPPAFLPTLIVPYMSNKLDKTGHLLYLRRTTVLFKNNSAWCAVHVRGLKNAAKQLKIPLRGSDIRLH